MNMPDQSLLRQAQQVLEDGSISKAAELVRQARRVERYHHSPEALTVWHAIGRKAGRRRFCAGWHARTFTEHTRPVASVAFSPDGQHALLGGEDQTLRLWEWDWEYDCPEPADFDEEARPYLAAFLTLHTPIGPDGVSRVGTSSWDEDEFQRLLEALSHRGYGWLGPEGVRQELVRRARGGERLWKRLFRGQKG
jgi:hypothetical protein